MEQKKKQKPKYGIYRLSKRPIDGGERYEASTEREAQQMVDRLNMKAKTADWVYAKFLSKKELDKCK